MLGCAFLLFCSREENEMFCYGKTRSHYREKETHFLASGESKTSRVMQTDLLSGGGELLKSEPLLVVGTRQCVNARCHTLLLCVNYPVYIVGVTLISIIVIQTESQKSTALHWK